MHKGNVSQRKRGGRRMRQSRTNVRTRREQDRVEGPRNFAPVQSPKKQVLLKVISTAIISGASPQVTKRWNPNSAYTPETGGGSGATPGYADWAQLYGYYRVIGYSYSFTASNNEAFPVIVYSVNSNNDPTTSNNSTLATNRNSFTKQLAAKGGIDSWTFRSPYYPVTYIVGSPAPKFDDLYSALVNASPSDLTWMGIGAQSIGGANITNGISVSLQLNQFVIFYDPLQQI
jgi:hypothetical protein